MVFRKILKKAKKTGLTKSSNPLIYLGGAYWFRTSDLLNVSYGQYVFWPIVKFKNADLPVFYDTYFWSDRLTVAKTVVVTVVQQSGEQEPDTGTEIRRAEDIGTGRIAFLYIIANQNDLLVGYLVWWGLCPCPWKVKTRCPKGCL